MMIKRATGRIEHFSQSMEDELNLTAKTDEEKKNEKPETESFELPKILEEKQED